MSDTDYGDRPWWERPTAPVKDKKRSRNDLVADLWDEAGWVDDDGLWRETDDLGAEGLGHAYPSWYGSRRRATHAVGFNTQQKAATAHRMVQEFVDAFSTATFGYRVAFDPTISTAATDFTNKRVVISPAPIFDKGLTAREAGLILTGMACHEVAHVRYHQTLAAFVTKTFANTPDLDLARRLSNLLADVHDEGAFSASWPGFSDVFGPTLEYVVGDGKGKVPQIDGLNFAIGAVRYSQWLNYNSQTLIDERDWWLDWAARGTSVEGGKHHVTAIREAIARIGSFALPQNPNQPQPQPGDKGEDGEGEGNPQPTPGEGSDESGNQPSQGGDKDGDDQSQGGGTDTEQRADTAGDSDEPLTTQLPGCTTDGVAQAAKRRGVNITEDDIKSIQKAVDEARTLEGDDAYGKGHVLNSPKTLGTSDNGSRRVKHSGQRGVAAASIRAAFERSRSGHTTYDNHRKRGHLSAHDLHRIANNDTRLFERRKAPSVGKFLVWIMVDVSSSMSGQDVFDAADVAQAFVEATSQMGNVRANVWAWTTPWGQVQQGLARFGAVKLWDDSRPHSDVQRITTLPMGGTPDAAVLAWASVAIKKAAAPSEQPIIILVSDGMGMDLSAITTKAAKNGVRIVGVNVGSSHADASLKHNYGDGNYVPWMGSILKMARPLGILVGKAITPKSGGAR